MEIDPSPTPMAFKGVMVSSTFTDLEKHRGVLMDALRKLKLVPIVMEDFVASPDDEVINSSLAMVGEAHAYIVIISLKYGQVPKCSIRNRSELSITELEFNEAQKLKRPILVFIMGENHPVTKKDIELDPVKARKLEIFRERAKIMGTDSGVHRIYIPFDSLGNFTTKAIYVVANLRRHLDEQGGGSKLGAVQRGVQVIPQREWRDFPNPDAINAELTVAGQVGERPCVRWVCEWLAETGRAVEECEAGARWLCLQTAPVLSEFFSVIVRLHHGAEEDPTVSACLATVLERTDMRRESRPHLLRWHSEVAHPLSRLAIEDIFDKWGWKADASMDNPRDKPRPSGY